MKQSIKISDEELNEIKELRQKYQELHSNLGNLKIEEIELNRMISNLTEKDKNLKQQWFDLQVKEQDLIEKVSKKYGNGSLNLADGTFTTS